MDENEMNTLIHQRVVERHDFVDGTHRKIYWMWYADGTIWENVSQNDTDGGIYISTPIPVIHGRDKHEMFADVMITTQQAPATAPGGSDSEEE